MKGIIVCIVILFSSFGANAQKDTVYLLFQSSESFQISGSIRKAPNNPDKRMIFPFNGGKYYQYKKEVGRMTEDILFF